MGSAAAQLDSQVVRPRWSGATVARLVLGVVLAALLFALAGSGLASAATVSSRPASSSDDVEQSPSGTIYSTSSDLELVYDGANQTVGIRFPGLAVPAGATIVDARIEFQVDEVQSEATTLRFAAHATANAPTFASTSFAVSSRPQTTAAVVWSDVPAWSTAGQTQQTPSLAQVVQEVVATPGWTSGNAIAFIVTGSGHRTAVAYDDSAASAPRLVVSYATDAPVVSSPGDQVSDVGAVVSLQISASDPNGDPLSFSATGLPPDLEIHPVTGLVSGTVATGSQGAYTVTVTASDGGNSGQTTFSWTVLGGGGGGGDAVTFAVIGDYGLQWPAEGDVANLVASWDVDFVVTVGDNNYSSDIDANIGQYYHQFIKPYTGSYGAGSPDVNRFFPALGNHDFDSLLDCSGGTCSGQYLDYFVLPGNERYYDVSWGPVQLFIVDSDEHEPDGNTSTSVQAQWLQSRLASSTSPWRLVFFHHPPYTSGNGNGDTPEMRWPFEAWGATAVLAGHEHLYERLRIGNIPYFVNGLGGGSMYPFGPPVAGSEVRYNADAGAMRVTADASSIVFEFVNRAGVVIDTAVQYAADPPPAPPANLLATAGNGHVLLDWDDNAEPDLAGYRVYRSTSPDGPYTLLAGGLLASAHDDATVANGLTYYYTVRATDTAGGESSASNEASATPQGPDMTPPPVPAITSGPPDPTNATSATFTFSDAEPGVSFLCSLEGSAFAGCVSGQSYAGLADGSHTFGVKAQDAAGNESAPASHAWTVDTVAPPVPAIVSGPPDPSASRSATFAFSDGEAGLVFLCRLDGAAFASCASGQSYSGLANGGHLFEVKARDAAGNESAPAGYAWTVAAAVTYRDEVLADAPVAYWRLGETSGTSAADETAGGSSGSYRNGVVLGVSGALPGDPNRAARFDGTNDLVRMGDPASGVLDFGTSDFSAEMWVRTSVAGERVILGKRASSVFWLVTVTDDSGRVGMLRAAIRAGSSQRTAYSSVRVDDGAWHHVVVLFDRDSTISFFVDGAPAGSTAVASTGSVSNSGDFQLAKLSGYTHFGGDLDEVALYRSLLPAGRIQAHFAAR